MKTRGSILVAAIWVLVFFSALGTAIYKIFYSQVNIAERLQSRMLSPLTARAAVVLARQILRDRQEAYDTLGRWNQIYERKLGATGFRFTLIDEERKINVNRSTPEVFSRLPGFSSQTVENIQNYPFRPFGAIEELLLVDGVEAEAFAQVRDLITIHGSGMVNINTASPIVLGALGLDDRLIQKIIDFRSGTDRVEGTEDDRTFENTGDLISVLKGYVGLSSEEEAAINRLMAGLKLTVKADHFEMALETQLGDKVSGQYKIIMNKDSVLQWREF